MKKCLVLFSGGYDSILTLLLMKEQVHVEGIKFNHGFAAKSTKDAIDNLSMELDIKINQIDIQHDYLKMLFNPRYGYGKNMNPCVDCHSLFTKLAWEYAQKNGFDFLASGEVYNQRPMSQTKEQLKKVSKLIKDVEPYLVRPLSINHFKEPIPITEKWLDKSKLLNIQGRSRQIQLEKIKHIPNLESYSSFCLLTDKKFSDRLRYMKSVINYIPNYKQLLTIGRHLKLEDGLLIVGRNKTENEFIESFRSNDFKLIKPKLIKSPSALITKNVKDVDFVINLVLNFAKIESNNVSVDFDNFNKTVTFVKLNTKQYLI